MCLDAGSSHSKNYFSNVTVAMPVYRKHLSSLLNISTMKLFCVIFFKSSEGGLISPVGKTTVVMKISGKYKITKNLIMSSLDLI